MALFRRRQSHSPAPYSPLAPFSFSTVIELIGIRERRRPPTLGSDGHLSGWTHPAVQSAPRTGSRGAPLAVQLSGPQGGNREHLRTQSRAVASGQNRVKGPEEEP